MTVLLLGVLATIAWFAGQIRATMASISTARCSSRSLWPTGQCHRYRCVVNVLTRSLPSAHGQPMASTNSGAVLRRIIPDGLGPSSGVETMFWKTGWYVERDPQYRAEWR